MDVTSHIDSWGSTAILAGVVIVLLIIYNEWNHTSLRKCGIPGPRGLPLLGNIHTTLKMGIVNAEKKWSETYGDVFGWRQGSIINIFIKDPDILKEVFVKEFSNFTNRQQTDLNPSPMEKMLFSAKDKSWKRLRAIMSPTFSTGKLKHMTKDINRCAEHLTKNFEKAAETDGIVKVKDFFGAYTMDVIASTSFGLDVDSQKNPDEPFIHHAREIFKPRGMIPAFTLANIFPWASKIMKPLSVGFFTRGFIDFFKREVSAMIKDRRQNKSGRTDFLQLMMNAELMDERTIGEIRDLHKKMTVDEMIAQSILFFIAGYETTASLLQYTGYQLALNADTQNKLLEEIERELGNEEPTYENVSKLQYMEQVLYEVLRMYPPVSRINRQAAKDITINGVTIPKGAAVGIPIYNIHHDKRFYPDPDHFNPDRFASKTSQSNISFLSFGFGPRLCLGMRLALVEAKVALIHVLRKVRFTPSPATKIPLEIRKNNGLTQPASPIEVKVESRVARAAA